MEGEDVSAPLLFWSQCGHFLVIADEDQFFHDFCKSAFSQNKIAAFVRRPPLPRALTVVGRRD